MPGLTLKMPDGNSGTIYLSHYQNLTADVVQVCEILSGKNVIRPDPDVQQPFVQQLRLPATHLG